MKECISHIYQDTEGNWNKQSNDEHSRGVAELAKQFADEFGMGDWGFVLGLLHDKGKERVNFQSYIRKSSGYQPELSNVGRHEHAFVGGIIAKQLYGNGANALLCNQIASHHRGLYDYDELEIVLKQEIPKGVNVQVKKLILEKPSFEIKSKADYHHLSRMLFSCLTDADYIDTEAFMDKASSELRKNNTTLAKLLELLEKHLATLQENTPRTSVNAIRSQVQQQCCAAAECSRGFYSLTVPTGGGKTLSSVLWAMKHAVRNGQKRVIIAIPYTSIIVQTAAILKNIFGEENALEHHCNFDDKNIKDEQRRERAKLATENWNCPIVVTTNVQLFESMFANKPSVCRKLHNMVNSVIILDEVQTLPTDFLQPIIDSLKTYHSLFGVSVLFTTASQPLLRGTIEGCNTKAVFPAIENIREIIPKEFELDKKLKRVNLKIDNSGKSYDEVAAMVIKHERVLCIVNTRKDAKELYDRLPKEGITLHLSRMMCPKHVRKTIEQIKTALENNSNKIIRVVSTQLVEAGVDIDFPVVFRQEAGLDSVLQAAGRCNREGKLDIATTYVFSLSKERPLPRGFMQAANNARLALGIDRDWFASQTMTDYFRQLYCRCETFDKKDMKNYLYKPTEMMFETAAKEFRLIEDTGKSVIINMDDSMELVEKLKEEGISYKLMKKLNQYSVNIHEQDFKQLINFGIIEEVIDGIYVIKDREQYDKEIGLKIDNHWLEEILAI